jgi:hypothetical protein
MVVFLSLICELKTLLELSKVATLLTMIREKNPSEGLITNTVLNSEAYPCIFSMGCVAVSVHCLVSDLKVHFLMHQEQCL